jgi:sugar lactone lactonase YvrE
MFVKSVCLIITLMLLPLVPGVRAQGEGTTVASGLNGPMGVLVAPDGSVWVIDSGTGGDADLPFVNPQTGQPMTAKFGETAQIVQVSPDGSQTVITNLPSVATGMDTLGGARLALVDGTVYATSGQWMGEADSTPGEFMAAVVSVEDGQVTQVADTWGFESAQNPDGHVLDSHPYDIIAGPDGNLLVADAAGNDLLRINPASGEIQTVAVFEGLPSPLPNPGRGGAQESDPVPTGVAIGQDGNIYVGFLSGFPFLPGAAKVVQVSADGQVTDYATGLSTLTDLVAGPDGNLYAVQFADFSEQGPAPNSGRVIRIGEGDTSEVVVEGLSFPTAIDFNSNGDAYVAINGVGAPGSGEVVMFAGLTNQAGSPLPAPEPAPATEAEPAPTEQPAQAEQPAAQAPAAQPPAQGPAALPQAGAPGSQTLSGLLLAVGIGFIGAGFLLRSRRKG